MSTQAQKRWNSDIRNYENNTGRFASQTQSQNMNENTPKTSGNGADAFQEPGTTSNKRKNHFDVPGDQLEASSNSAFLVRQENSDKFTYVLVEGVAPPMLTGISAKDLAQMSRRAKKAWNKDLLHFANGTGRFTPVLIPEKVTVQKATADFHSHPYTNIPRQLSINNNVSPPLRFFKRPRNGRHTFGLPAFLYKDPNNRGMLLYNAAVIDPPMHIDPDLYSKMTSEAQEEWAVRKEKALADLKTRLDSMTSAVRKL
ncbi:hypothetical protein BCR33DRAFT_713547 [Rhizoclosmatium globosum]|uniref:Uncharacterized protein n=1 Tax=Rhizoclosmatium globosum TaxID=329046 RepID=A0A1Y2CSK7_9FUNG|nr:hypothetical protein BCR33DRAFT_713547 [Rhizoclosmatium globosum]|eukprot:ORY49953.1 hypothetical protein BCR33DRAFT_713547 [Rhizoclosmatium globosum]